MSGKPTFGRRKIENTASAQAPQISPLRASSRLGDLLKVPHEQHSAAWAKEFEKLIVDACFHQLDARQMGPDMHHYVTLCLADKDEPNATKFMNVGKKAMNSGLGLAIFTPGNAKPDFVFTLGELITVAMEKKIMPLEISKWLPERAFTVENHQLAETDTTVFAAQVSPDWMPEPARKAMREYLEARYGITGVRVQGRTEMEDINIVYRGIIFNFPTRPDCDLNYLMQDLLWFTRPGLPIAMLLGPTMLEFFPL